MVHHLDWIEKMCLLCMHVGYICACYVCMVVVIVTFLFPCRSWWCCCRDVFVMNVCRLYMHLLCMSMSICCYACIVIVKVVFHEVIVYILGPHDVVRMLWCWCVGWDREGDANHQSEFATLNVGVRVDRHTSLYGGYACMLVNGCYNH